MKPKYVHTKICEAQQLDDANELIEQYTGDGYETEVFPMPGNIVLVFKLPFSDRITEREILEIIRDHAKSSEYDDRSSNIEVSVCEGMMLDLAMRMNFSCEIAQHYLMTAFQYECIKNDHVLLPELEELIIEHYLAAGMEPKETITQCRKKWDRRLPDNCYGDFASPLDI